MTEEKKYRRTKGGATSSVVGRLRLASSALTQELITRQDKTANATFARKIGISPSSWAQIKGGWMAYGSGTLNKIAKAFPELKPLIDQEILDQFTGQAIPAGRSYPSPLIGVNVPVGVSTNHAYGVTTTKDASGKVRGKHYMTADAREFKKLVNTICAETERPGLVIPKGPQLVIRFDIYDTYEQLVKRDWDGYVKLAQDAIFDRYGLDDALVWDARVVKHEYEQTQGRMFIRLDFYNEATSLIDTEPEL